MEDRQVEPIAAFRIPPYALRTIDAAAANTGQTRSDILRALALAYVEKQLTSRPPAPKASRA